MRAARLWLLSLAAACGGAPMPDETTDWTGPAVTVVDLPDGSVQVELMAPTGGHAFELEEVVVEAAGAQVRCRHTTPGKAIVAQVLTPLRLTVPAARLGTGAQVRVSVATWERDVAYVRAPDHVLAAVHRRR